MACGWERISNDVEVGLRLGGGHGFFVKIEKLCFAVRLGYYLVSLRWSSMVIKFGNRLYSCCLV